MCQLKKGAAADLRALEGEADWSERGAVQAPDLPGLLSLYHHFRQIPDFRSAHGRRYSLAMVLAIRHDNGVLRDRAHRRVKNQP